MRRPSEISADDVIEVVDPNRRISVAGAVGYDTAIILPRRKLARYVSARLAAVAGVVLVGSPRVQMPRARAQLLRQAAAAPRPARCRGGARRGSLPVAAARSRVHRRARCASTRTVEGQRVFVDGVVAHARPRRCSGADRTTSPWARSVARARIDVPCGGEVTVYR